VFALGKWDGFTNQITQSHLANKKTEVFFPLSESPKGLFYVESQALMN
jgi:hypothetical protein